MCSEERNTGVVERLSHWHLCVFETGFKRPALASDCAAFAEIRRDAGNARLYASIGARSCALCVQCS